MPVETTDYGLRVRLPLPFEEVRTRVNERLAEQGFGVLTEIDVRETLQRKLGAAFRRYVILGACNPQLAFRALSAEIEVGLLLPCNVVVYEEDEGHCVVAAVNPDAMLGVVRGANLDSVAAEAKHRLQSALEALAT